MSQLVLEKGVSKNLLRNLKNLFPGLQFGPYFLIGSLVFFVALVTVITLMFSTRQVTKGYVLNRLGAERQDLIKENEQKEMEISKVRSLNFIQKSSKVQGMKRPDQVVYVQTVGDTAIASK